MWSHLGGHGGGAAQKRFPNRKHYLSKKSKEKEGGAQKNWEKVREIGSSPSELKQG
jgi:hypothetical protein